jgi:DnaJ family protein B protein 4
MASTDFYNELGVSKDASESDIKKAFRSLSLKYHPDRNPSEDATSKFQAINEAYETLSDSEKRQQYDMQSQFGGGGGMPHGMPFGFGGMPGMPGGMPFAHMDSMNEFSDMNNIFNMFFGGMHGQGQGGPGIHIFHGPGMNVRFQTTIQKPEAITLTIPLTMEQCYQGCNLPVEIERLLINGNNRETEKEVLHVNIPQGVDTNDGLLIQDKGHIINNSVHGDVKLIFQITNDTEFVRQGLDLVYHKKITLKEALCGFSFEISHLNGKKLCLNNINNPTVIKPNYKKVVPNMGMIRENTTGNMIIEFELDFPEMLTAEQLTALREIL